MPSATERVPVSVVVIGYAPSPLLERCLAALATQHAAHPDVEVLVVGHWDTRPDVRPDHYPGFRWLAAPPTHNVARMRGLGIARTRGDVVAFLEGDCLPGPGWLGRVAVLAPAGAVAGPIEPGALRRAVDWAAYFSEFAPFMAPPPVAPTELPGTNVAYRRAALPVRDFEADGFYETFLNETLRDGPGLATDPALVVYHERTWEAHVLLATRYHHGRGYAGLRVASRSPAARGGFAVLALALPVVLAARTFGAIVRRRRHVGRALRAALWIVALAASWSAGEFVGYVAGPGQSLARWR
jgi:hypothetical protein